MENKERVREIVKLLGRTKLHQKVECHPEFKFILKSSLEWASKYSVFNSAFSPDEIKRMSHITGGAYLAACYSKTTTDLSRILPGAYHTSCCMMYDDLIDNAVDLETAEYLTSAIITCIDQSFVDEALTPFAESWAMLPFTENELRSYGHLLKKVFRNIYKLCEFQFNDLNPTIEEYLRVRRIDLAIDPYALLYFYINQIPFDISKFKSEQGVRFRNHAWQHGAIQLDIVIFFSKQKGVDGKEEPRLKFNIINLIQREHRVDLASSMQMGLAMLRFEEDCILKMVEENQDEEFKVIYDVVLQCHAHIMAFVNKFQDLRYK